MMEETDDLPILKPIKKKNKKVKKDITELEKITAKPSLEPVKFQDNYEKKSGFSNFLGFKSDREAKNVLDNYLDLFMKK